MPTKSYHHKTITRFKYSYYKTITNKASTRFPHKSYHYKTITSRTATRFPYKTKHFRTISHYGITSKHKTNHFKTTNIKLVPAPRCKFLTRPPEQNQRYTITTATTTNFDQILAHLTAINQPQALEPMHEDQLNESSPSSSATTSTDLETETTSTDSTTDTSSNTSSLDETTSTSSEISTTSTLSDCQLRPRYPINYNEKVLTKLHELLQIKTLNNLSIPLPVTESESEEGENYEHCIKLDIQTFNNQV